MKKWPLVSVIIVNWNGGEVFRNCLVSISRVDYPNWELIVVDNGGTDKNYRLLANSKLIRNKENVGFAKANNQGYKKSKGDYILLLNNDTKVTPGFLKYLVGEMEKDSSFAVTQPKLKIMDNPDLLDNSGAFFTRSGFLEHWGYLAKDGSGFRKEREVFSTKGACMLIRREIIERVGLFDETFVSYMEETDFCWRVWLSGGRVMFLPGTSIYHKVGFTSKRQVQTLVNYHSFKNRLAALIKNLEPTSLLIIGGFHLILILTLSFYYLIRFQLSKTIMIWKAVFWNIFNLGRTLKKRKFIQAKRSVSDKEIFRRVMVPISWQKMFRHFIRVEANF